MNFTLSYLAANRLGELAGLKANDISPMHDLMPVIGEMQNTMDPQVFEKLDELLAGQKLINEN